MQKGSLVECIDDSFDAVAHRNLAYMPVRGVIYTVRAIVYDWDVNDCHLPAVLLEEIVNPHKWFEGYTFRHFVEPRFRIRRFREVLPPMDIGAMLRSKEYAMETCLIGVDGNMIDTSPPYGH